MLDLITSNIINILLILVLVGFKRFTIKKGGKIIHRQYSVINQKEDFILSALFLLLFGAIIYTRFSIDSRFEFSDLSPFLLIPICYFIVYPWNLYFTSKGIIKSYWFSLNSYVLESINRSDIKEIQIKPINSKYQLVVTYQKPYQLREKKIRHTFAL